MPHPLPPGGFSRFKVTGMIKGFFFVWEGGGGLEIFSSRIFGGLEIWQVLFGWFDLRRDFLGYWKQSKICSTAHLSWPVLIFRDLLGFVGSPRDFFGLCLLPILPADVPWRSFVTHSFLPHWEKWMRDERTPKDVCAEAIFCPLRSSPSLEIQSTPLGLNPLVPQFCIHHSKRLSYYLWYLILNQHFYMVDIERFSDRYREKQTDEGLDWQPGNISVLVIYCIIYLTLKGVAQQNMF